MHSTPARRGRQRASTWSRQNTISESTGGGNISTPVVGSDRCGCAVARLQPPGLLLAKTKRRQCRCRLDSGGLDSGDPNHGRAAPIPTKRNHGRHGKGSPRHRSRRNLSAGAGRASVLRPAKGHQQTEKVEESCAANEILLLLAPAARELPTRIHSETAAASRVNLEPWILPR